VGLATSYALLQRLGGISLTLYEKESALGAHQTGRNSGVIHSGVYYPSNSLKLRFCRDGRERLINLCRAWNIPLRQTGKLIVAVEPGDLPGLEALRRRAKENGIPCRLLSRESARDLVPRVKALRAILIDDTALVDFGQVARKLGEKLRDGGGHLRLGTGVRRFVDAGGDGVLLESSAGRERYDFVVNCAGLHADKLAGDSGLDIDLKIIPFRGDYYRLQPRAAEGLNRFPIYPVPDSRFPFLGVHLTPTLSGEVTAGPNAVLALAREGYRRGQIHWKEALESLAYPGLRSLMRRYWRVGLEEWRRSLSRDRFARAVARLVEGVVASDLEAWPSGVRAQAVLANGDLADDFVLRRGGNSLHVLNAPSPAATASLAIGEHIASQVLDALGQKG
jgi:L-2-hydroxyglutarate oxidase